MNMIVTITPIALLLVIILGCMISQAMGNPSISFENILPTFGIQNRIIILG